MASTLPASMKAAQRSHGVHIEKGMQVNNVPLPRGSESLPAASTLVKVAYASLNPVDYKIAEFPMIGRFITRIPGSDFAGTVVSSTNTDLKPGQAVFGMINPPSFGALAEYVMVGGHENVAPLPAGIDLKDAAALGVVATTAYQCIVPFVREGEKVMINGGSGGVGTFGIQLAKAVGCYVTATCSGPNVELVKSLGADEVIDYRTTNVVDYLRRQGTQYSLILDCVGTPEIYYSAQHYLKPDGVFNAIAADPLSFVSIWRTGLMFLLPKFLGGGQRNIKFIGAKADAIVFTRLAQWMREGKLKTHIDQEYQLVQIAEAFAKLKTGRTRGKIIVRVA